LRYGLRFLINIAPSYGSGEIISISQVSKEEDISNKYLEQIISSFVKAGIIKGSRGKGGGYSIIKDPKNLTVYDIACSLGEDFTFINCVRNRNSCKNQPDCGANDLWSEMSNAVTEIFKKHTLFELVEKHGKPK
jgi:Rrf2 family protein